MALTPIDLALGTSLVVHRVGAASNGIEDGAVFLFFCLYSALMESSRLQATFGKRAVGIIVADQCGGRISFRRAFVRSLAQITGLGYLGALFSKRRSAFHDVLVKTQVTPSTL